MPERDARKKEKECQKIWQKTYQTECQEVCKECQKISYSQYVKVRVTGRISISVLAAVCKDA